MRPELKYLATALLLVVCQFMSACSNEPSVTPGTEPSVRLDGPIEVQGRAMVFGLNRIRSGKWSDVLVGEIRNTGGSTVTLESVVLSAEQDASQLRFDGAFVAPSGTQEQVSSAGSLRGLAELNGYHLKPQGQAGDGTPLLVIRIGPALRKDTDGFDVSRNNNVNLFYSVGDERYVAIYPMRYEYPN